MGKINIWYTLREKRKGKFHFLPLLLLFDVSFFDVGKVKEKDEKSSQNNKKIFITNSSSNPSYKVDTGRSWSWKSEKNSSAIFN
jgi:hypothetical protein